MRAAAPRPRAVPLGLPWAPRAAGRAAPPPGWSGQQLNWDNVLLELADFLQSGMPLAQAAELFNVEGGATPGLPSAVGAARGGCRGAGAAICLHRCSAVCGGREGVAVGRGLGGGRSRRRHRRWRRREGRRWRLVPR